MKHPDYHRTSKGDNILARYAVEGEALLNDPEVQVVIKDYRASSGSQLSDKDILDLMMRILAAQGHQSS